MALTDTAEYWQDVKRKAPYMGRQFIHMPNSNCGHLRMETGNVVISKYLNDINCFACLELIRLNGNIYDLKEGVSKKEQSKIDKDKHRFRFGKCECGSPMCERKNSKTKEKFLGCSNYPKCKRTRAIG